MNITSPDFSEQARIFVVGDSTAEAQHLVAMLDFEGYEVSNLCEVTAVEQIMEQDPPDLILLDIGATDNGLECCRLLKSRNRYTHIPVIILCDTPNAVDRIGVFAVGAADYLARPYEKSEVLARVSAQLRLARLQSELQNSRYDVNRLAAVDPLTGLYNRRRIVEQITHCLSRADRYGSVCSIVMFDLDDFKLINAKYGYEVGDKVLYEVAQRTRNALRESDLAARWAGEEFAILATDTALEATVCMAKRLQKRISDEPVGPVHDVTASFGVAAYEPNKDTLQSLILRADEALVMAKQAGRNCIQVNSETPLKVI